MSVRLILTTLSLLVCSSLSSLAFGNFPVDKGLTNNHSNSKVENFEHSPSLIVNDFRDPLSLEFPFAPGEEYEEEEEEEKDTRKRTSKSYLFRVEYLMHHARAAHAQSTIQSCINRFHPPRFLILGVFRL